MSTDNDPATNDADAVLYDVQGRTALITLNRPERLNAWNGDLAAGYFGSLDRAAADPGVGAIVVTGAGRGFCAGADMDVLQGIGGGGGDGGGARETRDATYALSIPKPIIAAVNGAAVGYGMELALLADIRVASSSARFSEMFVKRAIVAGHDSFELLPRMVGPAAAAEILLTGDIIEAERALELGLVSQVVADDELLPAARALAKRITANAPLAVQAAKEALRLERAGKASELRAHLKIALGDLLASDDHQESVAAFLERRDPTYKGR